MIRILKLFLESEEKSSEVYLKCKIDIPRKAKEKWQNFSKRNKSYTYIRTNYCESDGEIEIWFKSDIKYKEFLCDDRIDCFVIAMIYYAMVTGEDIVSDIPISEKLKFNLNNLLIPTFCNKYTGFKRIWINAPCISEPYITKGYVGTGMSCGIDSFHTLYSLTKKNVETNYKLTHLVFINAGAAHFIPHINKNATLKDINAEAKRINIEKIKKATEVAKELNLELIIINSNISDLYQGLFGPSNVYRNLAAILAFQKFFKRYYYSSAGYDLDCYNPSLFVDPAHCELLTIPPLSTETTDIICGSKAYTRFTKTEEISDFAIAQKYLNVCNMDENCCDCSKCYRTLITLEILGKLDRFKNTFNIEKYKKNKSKAYLWLLNTIKTDDFSKEIYINAKRLKKIPFKIRIINIFYKPFFKIYMQLKKIRKDKNE